MSQFDIAGPIQSKELAALIFAIHSHLARLLGLSALDQEFSLVSEFVRGLIDLAPIEAWERDSFLEQYCQRVDLDLSSVLAKLLRDTPGPGFDPTLLGLPAVAVPIPPLIVPLLPVAWREKEVTIASYVPGLNRLLLEPVFQTLNVFWGVERINCVWSEPAHLREIIRQMTGRIDCDARSAREILKAENGGVPWIDLDGISPSDKINQWFSATLQRRYSAAPVYCGKRLLTLAVPRLVGPQLKAEIEGALRNRFFIQQVLTDEEALQRFISASESRAINTSGIVQTMVSVNRLGAGPEALEVIQADELQQPSGNSREDEQAVIKFVHSILYKAVDMGASDIMFQEFPQKLRVCYKVDGDWSDENGEFPGQIAKQVISRIKVISGLEIQYVRLPQDGTFPIKIGDQRYDIRVNTSCQAQGEQAVLRLQRDHRHIKTLTELGVPDRYVAAIDNVMSGDHGLLILCGPTGSGKTTTIYSILHSLDAVRNNILTAESPIEIYIENISQTQIDDNGPYSYAMWARGVLRQAPDIVMMGEIRDEESVEALMRLSSSGHRAISTLHINSVCEVPSRFFLFQAHPFMVADSLKLAISQRLVKKVCPRCAREEPIPSEERLYHLDVNPAWLEGARTLRRGGKCDFCRHSGVSGRKAIFEALMIDDELKVAIQERAPAVHLRKLMEAKGESGLFEKAIREAAKGVITLEEACKFRQHSGRGEARLVRGQQM